MMPPAGKQWLAWTPERRPLRKGDTVRSRDGDTDDLIGTVISAPDCERECPPGVCVDTTAEWVCRCEKCGGAPFTVDRLDLLDEF